MAALLLLHSVLPAWSMDPDATAKAIEGVHAADPEEDFRTMTPSESGMLMGAMSEQRDPVSPKSPILALAQTTDSSATPNSQAIRAQAPTPYLTAANVSERWQLAPIGYWGDLAYDFRRTSIEGQPRFTRNSAIVNLNASTYVYEPWVAIVTAGLGLTASRLLGGELASGDRFATGYAKLNVFPMSRFPFEARFLRSNSAIDSDLGADQSYRLTRYGLSQRYRSEDGGAQYSASFDRFSQDSTTVGKDIQDALQFDVNTRVRRNHELQLLGILNHNQRVNTGERNDYETIVARHTFRPDPTLSWETSANFTHTDSRFAFAENELRIFQLNSIAFWRPTGQPVMANGSVRLFSLENGSGQNSVGTTAINVSAGVNYTVSRSWRAFGDISITDAGAPGKHDRSMIGTFGTTYQGNTIELSKYRYDWSVGETGIFSNGAADRNGLSFNSLLGHSLNRAFFFGNGNAITFNVAQNLSAITGAQAEASQQLFNSGSITWNKIEPESNSSSFVRLSASDSRYLDGQRETFQLLNLQLTHNVEFGRTRTFSGNLTLQATRRVSERPGFENSVNAGKPEPTASADLNYRHQKVFGIPRMVFFSQLLLNRQELVQPLGAPIEREFRSWENRLDYNIGRLETRLLARLADVDRAQRWLLMFRVIRRF